jgi:hyperosmotically inducible periplasmic protein
LANAETCLRSQARGDVKVCLAVASDNQNTTAIKILNLNQVVQTPKENFMVSFQKIFVGFIVAASVFAAGCASTPRQESFGEGVDDTVITTKVKALYVEDKTVSALGVNVETFKGTVQLSGFANDQNEINRAVEIARGVKGVSSVKNDIRLKTSAK